MQSYCYGKADIGLGCWKILDLNDIAGNPETDAGRLTQILYQGD